jgi:hypothetical protein
MSNVMHGAVYLGLAVHAWPPKRTEGKRSITDFASFSAYAALSAVHFAEAISAFL